jgi:hypothetical protein
VGEETMQFASRFSNAVSLLALLARDDAHAELVKAHGKDLPRKVSDAFDAVQAVYETGTQAVRDWPEQRQRVLAQLGRMRAALRSAGVAGEVRRMAAALVELIEPRAPRTTR